VYDQKAGLFTSLELSDQNREIAKNLEEVRQDAIKSDILRRADENTRAVLTSLAASLGMEAEVIFDDCGAEAVALAPAKQTAPVIAEETADPKTANDCDTEAPVTLDSEPIIIEAADPKTANEAATIAHSNGESENNPEP